MGLASTCLNITYRVRLLGYFRKDVAQTLYFLQCYINLKTNRIENRNCKKEYVVYLYLKAKFITQLKIALPSHFISSFWSCPGTLATLVHISQKLDDSRTLSHGRFWALRNPCRPYHVQTVSAIMKNENEVIKLITKINNIK